jgi:hypothetical protein
MAITIDWAAKVINIPQSFLAALGGDVYELNLNALRLALKDLEDSEEGMPFPDTHRHETESTLAGMTFARKIEFINGYTITFEDGQYAVSAVGANSNIGDVMNLNNVSLRTSNSGGLVTYTPSSYFTDNDRAELLKTRKFLGNRQELSSAGVLVTYADDGYTVIDTAYIYDKDGNPITLDAGVPAIRRKTPL